jgi:DNA-binding XRE family transcriptional regulator
MKDLSYENFKKEALKDPSTKKEYEALAPIWDLRRKLIRLRTEKGMTQDQIAKKMGTNKSSISRLECGEKVNFPTLATISKYAHALGYNVSVEFKAIKDI